MAVLGIIATGAAFLNYRKAKAEYKQALLEDNTDAILAAVSQYNSSKYNQLDIYDKDEFKPKETDLFTVVPVINAGMMVGKMCRIQGVALFVNNTDHIFEISELEIGLKLYGEDTLLYQGGNFRIGAKESREIKWVPNAVGSKGAHVNFDLFADEIDESLSDVFPKTEALKKAEDAVITANHRGTHYPPIGLCSPNTIIIGTPPCVTADCWIKYNGFSAELQGIEEKKNIPGSFCYKGEAFYPYNDK